MQELRSTDILDNEILTDARKKAERILQKADEESEDLVKKLSDDIFKAKLQKENFFSKKLDAYEEDQKSLIPLEKKRFEVSFIQNALTSEIKNYLTSLSEEKRLEIVTKKIDFHVFSPDVNFKAFVYGFDLQEAKNIISKQLGKNLLSCEKTVFNKIVLEESYGLTKPQGIILESEDKSIRIRLSLSEVCGQLMNEKRKELANALFGGTL